jgi:hypothetical protein
MGIVLRVVIVLVVLFVAFIIRQYLSVVRGVQKRDKALVERLAPLSEKLDRGEAIDRREIERLAAVPELRAALYRILSSHGCKQMFPEEYLTRESEAAALLTHWMLHPHELQAAPETMELVTTLQRRLGRKTGEFCVFRYRMAPGHWAGEEWLLGIAGPFFDGEEPYESVAGAFSNCTDLYGQVSAATLVDHYVKLIQRNFRAAS